LKVAGINTLVARLIDREGGYVNHPADRGGPTKYGITLKTLAVHRGKPVTACDVRDMTKAEAADIYRAEYYTKPRIDTLPDGLQEQTFDMAVMSGPVRGVRTLQEALIVLGSEIKADGVIGPLTRIAARGHPPSYVNNVVVHLRIEFYKGLCAARSSQNVFLRGWTARARKFRTRIG
jgi:lysozyme family protein